MTLQFQSQGAESPLRDEELLARYRQGEAAAFSQLYYRHCRPLRFYVHSLTRDPARSDDILQEAFLRLLRVDPLQIRDSLKGFLYAIARNLVFQETRNAARDSALPLLSRPRDVEKVVSREEVERVSEALDRLPPEQREVVILKVYGGFTFSEIARKTEETPGTVTSRYQYALDKLSRFLSKPEVSR